MSLPFANDGSFFEQFQQQQQQQQRGRADQRHQQHQETAAPDAYSNVPVGGGAQAVQHEHSAAHWQRGDQSQGSYSQDWRLHSQPQDQQHHPDADDGSWGQQREWVPPQSAQSAHPGAGCDNHWQPLEPGEYQPEPGEAQRQEMWRQEQQFYAEAAQPNTYQAGSSSAQALDEQLGKGTYDSAAGLLHNDHRHQQQQQQYDVEVEAARRSYEQQAAYAEPPQINDFNECPTFNGPFPGFVFKLGASLAICNGCSWRTTLPSTPCSARFIACQLRTSARFVARKIGL